MSECKGLFGKIFGHNFKQYLERYIPQEEDGDLTIEGTSVGVARVNESCAEKHYVVRCKRCGEIGVKNEM